MSAKIWTKFFSRHFAFRTEYGMDNIEADRAQHFLLRVYPAHPTYCPASIHRGLAHSQKGTGCGKTTLDTPPPNRAWEKTVFLGKFSPQNTLYT